MAIISMTKRCRVASAGWVAIGCLLILPGGAAWGQWEQVHKLGADDAAADDRFGYSVSVSGNTIVVGAIWDDDGGSKSGSVYVFDAATGGQLHKLIADDAAGDDWFGISVSVDETTIVVGAYYDDDAGSKSGSAYVFDAATGEQLHKLTAADAAAEDQFGRSVSVDGGIVVVGAYRDDDAGVDSGSAYVFDAITGEQLHKLTADDAAVNHRFGCSVSISGSTIVVGAYLDDGEAGSAYIFDATTGQQLHKLTADDAAAADWFGYSVSVSGATVVVGAIRDDDAGSSSGSAYVFDATTGEQLHKLTADDAAQDDQFGYSVSISGDTIVVGSQFDDDAGSASGSAYVFDASAGEQLHKFTADDAAAEDYFGFSVSISGKTVVAGAQGSDAAGYNSGAAYVFHKDASCPADLNGDGKVNIDDLFLILGAWGTCEACPEDLNGDGKVNIDDIFEVLGAWGPCP